VTSIVAAAAAPAAQRLSSNALVLIELRVNSRVVGNPEVCQAPADQENL
jgi:hypothetical protein